ANNRLRAELTSTTFGQIGDDIVAMFERGNVPAEDFAEKFEKLMQRALLQSLTRNAHETQLQDWYEKFSDDGDSDDELNEEEIYGTEVLKGLRNQYHDIVEGAKKDFDQLKQVSGVDFASGDDSSNPSRLANSISGITENTANRLES